MTVEVGGIGSGVLYSDEGKCLCLEVGREEGGDAGEVRGEGDPLGGVFEDGKLL